MKVEYGSPIVFCERAVCLKTHNKHGIAEAVEDIAHMIVEAALFGVAATLLWTPFVLLIFCLMRAKP